MNAAVWSWQKQNPWMCYIFLSNYCSVLHNYEQMWEKFDILAHGKRSFIMAEAGLCFEQPKCNAGKGALFFMKQAKINFKVMWVLMQKKKPWPYWLNTIQRVLSSDLFKSGKLLHKRYSVCPPPKIITRSQVIAVIAVALLSRYICCEISPMHYTPGNPI